MKRSMAALGVCLLALAACADREAAQQADPAPSAAETGAPEASAEPVPTPTFAPGRALIDTEEGSVIVDVEKAETPEQRAVGLMHRESLEENSGMVFLFFEDYSGGFYMKNTLIPLSIAFFDGEGTIVSILDMEPCEADPCEIYDPGVSYQGALEVNKGAFDEWGVQVGDRITITH